MAIGELGACGFTVHDVEEFIESLDQEFFPPISQLVEIAAYAEKLADKGVVLVCRSADQLQGLIGFYCNDTQSKRAYISYLGVGAEHRGKGIAGLLLRASIDYARNAGFHTVGVHTWHTNAPALGLYKAHGFEVLDDQILRSNGLRTVRMALQLDDGGTTNE